MSRYENLFDIISEVKPKVLMEIGTWNGVHSAKMIMQAQKYYRPSHVEYYGFDLFEDFFDTEKEFCPKAPAKLEEATTRIDLTGCKYHITKGNTKDTLPNFKLANSEYADFIFIDGGHSLETIESDWNNLLRFIGKWTVIVFDDYYPDDETKGCKQLIQSLATTSNWIINLLEPIDYFKETDVTVQMVRLDCL